MLKLKKYNLTFYDETMVNRWGPLTGERLESMVSHGGDFHAILCSICNQITERVIEKAGKSLKVISTVSVGVDHIDLEAAKKRGILVGHTPDVLTPAMAELTIALLLATLRRIPEAISEAKTNWTRENAWKANWLIGRQIYGSVVGVIGLGRVGKSLIDRLIPFGPKKIASFFHILVVYNIKLFQVDLLFEKFYVSGTGSNSGKGLGLTIAAGLSRYRSHFMCSYQCNEAFIG